MSKEPEVVECSECEHVHSWCDRTIKIIDDFTCSFCPKCDEESYVNPDKQSLIRYNQLHNFNP